MKKRILSIVLTLCMVLMLVPTTVFAEECQHTDIDEYQVCKNCRTPVCPACHSPNGVVAAGYDPAECEKDGTWFILCFSSSCPAHCIENKKAIEGTVPALGHKDENKDHNCDHGCGKSDMGDHVDLNGDLKCDYGCSIPICDHKEIDESRICKACGQPICCRTCNKPFSLWTITEYPTCESSGGYTAIDCSGNPITVLLRSLGHLDENNDHICDRVECKKEGICVHTGTVNAYQTCDYCGLPVCPKCKSSRFIPLIDTSYHTVQATCEEDGSWEITCYRPSCEDAGGTFSGTVPAIGHKDENKDHNCDHACGKSDMGDHNDSDRDHACDYCDMEMTTCKDENPIDHNCDICGKTLSKHTGGEATCTSKAICDDCGNEYGEVDSANHNLEKIPAKAATVTNTGNKEYWHCKDCGKFFADENGTNEIKLNNTVLAKLAPEIIEGMGQSLTAGEKKALAFRSNAVFGDFIRVELDGSTLDAAHYSASEGSIIVILKADYVATLSVGTHTIGIVSTSGTAVTTFTVTDNAAKSPKTGDNSPMALWSALFFVSGGLLTVTGVYNKKKKRSAR